MTSLDWLPAAIRQSSALRQLEADEALFHQGDKVSAIFEVEQGRLRLIRHTINNQQVVLHTARSGELFAEAALFSDRYHCDAVSAVASYVRAYSKRKLLAAFRSDPALGEHFMASLAHQIQALRARLEQRNIRSARERVLHYLMLAAVEDGFDESRFEGDLFHARKHSAPPSFCRVLYRLGSQGVARIQIPPRC